MSTGNNDHNSIVISPRYHLFPLGLGLIALNLDKRVKTLQTGSRLIDGRDTEAKG